MFTYQRFCALERGMDDSVDRLGEPFRGWSALSSRGHRVKLSALKDNVEHDESKWGQIAFLLFMYVR